MLQCWWSKRLPFWTFDDAFVDLKMKQIFALEDLDGTKANLNLLCILKNQNWRDHVGFIPEMQVWLMIFIQTKQKLVAVAFIIFTHSKQKDTLCEIWFIIARLHPIKVNACRTKYY